ncbi:MAG: DUF4198 domain-containing protein [Pseudomonadota bacterium]
MSEVSARVSAVGGLWFFLAFFVLACSPGNAHEFWVEPQAVGPVKTGVTVAAHVRVGDHLAGQMLPYLPNIMKQMTHWGPDGQKKISAILGDRPAIGALSIGARGLHRITVETHPSVTTFDTMADFTAYLDYEGLSGIAAEHRARGLAENAIVEAFTRNAKALVQAGPVLPDHSDGPAGMPFEVVALDNPFAEAAQTADFELLWQGVPVAGWHLSAFHLPAGGSPPADTVRTVLLTDATGKITLDVSRGGRYLLNAVRLDPANGPEGAVWTSHWASLSFILSR